MIVEVDLSSVTFSSSTIMIGVGIRVWFCCNTIVIFTVGSFLYKSISMTLFTLKKMERFRLERFCLRRFHTSSVNEKRFQMVEKGVLNYKNPVFFSIWRVKL